MSAVTVRDLLTLPALRGCELLAGGAGLDREVTGVNVMEVPDIETFVEPGEVLLTTAYPLREHPEELGDLVRTLARIGLSALAVKTGRYLDRLPQGMLDAADELSLPLVLLRDDTSFNEVIGAVLAVVLSDYGADPAGAEAIRERLTGVALSGGGLDEIARTLGGALDRGVDIVDESGVTLLPPGPVAAGPLPWAFPVNVAGSERARILVGGPDEPTLGQRRLIRQACFAAGMHIAQALAGIELDRRMRVLSLEELVGGRSSEPTPTAQRARLYGWDLSGPRAVALVRSSHELGDSTVAATAEAAFGACVTWSRGTEAVAIVMASTMLAAAAAQWQADLVAAGGGDVIVGVGSTEEGADRLAASHGAALEAVTIAAAVGESVALHERLAVERAILAIPRDRLLDLVESELGPLLANDEQTGTDLCGTLEVVLSTGNAAEAARALFIHYNTMKHRLARIADVLGPRFDAPGSRLSLALALRARRLLGGAGGLGSSR